MITEEQIIKALGWLKEVMGVCSSDDKYIYGEIILDLINRQKAEISVLRKLLDKAETEMNNQSENIKKLTKDCYSMQSTLAKMSMGVEQARAEAIKECLNKVAVFCAESGLFHCEADEMLLFNYLDSLKMEAMLKANGMAGDTDA